MQIRGSFLHRQAAGHRLCLVGEEGLRLIPRGGVEIFFTDPGPPRGADRGEPDAEVGFDRSAGCQRRRGTPTPMRFFMRRNFRASQTQTRGVGEALRGHALDALCLDGLGPRPRRRKAFPEKVTAFRPEMPVHGASAALSALRREVQRIRYADNETNYCATFDRRQGVGGPRGCRGCWGPTGRGRWRSWRG